jgi:hypothetical protein
VAVHIDDSLPVHSTKVQKCVARGEKVAREDLAIPEILGRLSVTEAFDDVHEDDERKREEGAEAVTW